MRGWQVKKLRELAAITYGYTQSATASPIGPRFLRITDIQDDGVDWDKVPFCSITDDQLPKYRLSGGDIVFARTGATTGKSFLVSDPPEAVFASYLIRLRLHDSSVLPKFVWFFFQSDEYWNVIQVGSTGSARDGFNASKLGALSIPVPPLSKQRKIVDTLEEELKKIAATKSIVQRNLQNANGLFESYLSSVFSECGAGWKEDNLQELTNKIGSGATPLGGEQSYKAKGVSLIRSLNVHDDGFRYGKLAFIDEMQASRLENVEVHPGDVLLNITGASVARCCTVPEDVLPARVNQHVSILRPVAQKLDSAFLHYLLVSKPYKDRLLRTGEDGGSTRQAITKAQLKDFRVCHPRAVPEQRLISSKLDSLAAETKRLTFIYQRKLEALEALKRSLLSTVFSGGL